MEERFEAEKAGETSGGIEEEKRIGAEREEIKDTSEVQQEELLNEDENGEEMDIETKEIISGDHPLTLNWMLGLNKNIRLGVHDLTSKSRQDIFYASGHTGIIYNYISKKQILLQAHCNEVSATACSRDKKWLVTADLGNDSVLVIWDAETGAPVKTIFNPNPGGVRAVAISDDSEYIASLGEMLPDRNFQTLNIWKRDSEKPEPIASLEEALSTIEETIELDHVVFNGDDYHMLALNGKMDVFFIKWKEGERLIKDHYKGNRKSLSERYTMTAFIKNTELMRGDREYSYRDTAINSIRNEAVTATDRGKVVVWGKSVLSTSDIDRLSAIKVVQIGPSVEKGKEGGLDTTMKSMISVLISQDDIIIAGFGDGSVKFYSPELKVLMWFEKFGASEIKSISFSAEDLLNEYPEDQYGSSKEGDKRLRFEKFLVADASGVVRHLKPEMHSQPEDSLNMPEVLLEGFSEPVVCIAASPKDSILTLGIYRGPVIFWDYENRNEIEEKKIPKEKINGPWVMAYTPVKNDTLCLMVGCTDGILRVYPQEKNSPIQIREHKIKDQLSQKNKFLPEQIAITSDAMCMATRDNDYCVSVFKYETGANLANLDAIDWHFSGKIRSHKLPITSIAFVETKSATGKKKKKKKKKK